MVDLADNTDPSFLSTLDANNLGTFSWTYVNTTGASLTDVDIFVFLDADIDRSINGAANEYGQVVSQTLPPGSPANAVTWSSFQIDEPGFVSGTILNNLLDGFLDNTNHVPPGTTNDVSLALGFSIGTLLPGQQSTGTFTISTSDIGGLSQTDPDSNFTFYFNGDVTAPSNGPNGSGSATPEPGTAALVLVSGLALGAVWLVKKKKTVASFAVRSFRTRQAAGFAVLLLNMAFATELHAAGTIFNYSNFVSTAGLSIVGNATTASTGDGVVLRLTPAAGGQAGAAYSTSPVSLGQNSSFSTQFQFRITNPGGIDPADGITFVLAASPTGLGDPGGGLGYQGVPNSVAIEFDTFNNGAMDQNSSNHIAIDTGGVLTNTALANVYGIQTCDFGGSTSYTAAGCLSNGHLWTATITYDGANLTVKVIDPAEGTTFTAINNYPINIGSLLGTNTAYVGFTSGTGAGDENHDIVNWQFANTSQLPSLLPTISNLSARFKSASVDLTWQPPVVQTGTTIASYKVYRRSGAGVATVIQSGLSGTFFEDTGLTNGTPYYYTVTWVNGAGMESGPSTEMSATPTSLATQVAHKVPPTILSNPVVLATVGTAYTYPVQASDPNPGDILTYTLPAAPAGMAISASTGAISWTPSASQIGTNAVQVVVTNISGGFASQLYQITVQAVAPTVPPVITSTPLTTGNIAQEYDYQILATDQNPGAILSYSLLASPAGAIVNFANGLVQWVPATSQGGSANFTIQVQDQFLLKATQSFTVTVGARNIQSPLITSTPITAASATVVYSYPVTATDPNSGATLTYSLTSAPTGMTIGASTGVIQWTPTVLQEGLRNVAVRVQDSLGASASQLFSILVSAPQLPPTVVITGPAPGQKITSLTNITGSITDPNNGTAGPLTWTLGILKPGSSTYQTIASGSSAVSNGTIATIDPSLLPNNAYPLQLTVIVGNYVLTQNLFVNVTGGLKLGHFSLQYQDLAIPVAGVPLTLLRRYDSLDSSTGDFGPGWRLGLPGQVTDSANGQGFNTTTRVYVTLPNGTREGFTFNPTLPSVYFPVWFPGFTPDPGVTDTLSAPSDALFNSNGTFFDLSGPYSPTQFTLTTKYGTVYNLSEAAGLEKVSFPNGNTLTVSASGIISSTGVAITFQRDAQNRIGAMVDPKGNTIHYAYDAAGRLSKVTDENNNVTTFTYQGTSNYLTGIAAPGGCHPVTTVYDSAGRVASTTDSAGNQTLHTYDPANHQSTLTNSLNGLATTTYDGNGNTIRVVDSSGTVSYTYDANNNETSRTMPSGLILSHTYDAQSNPLTFTVTPVSGSPVTTTFTWNSQNSLTSIVYPSGKKLVLGYDAIGNLTSRQQQDQNNVAVSSETFSYDPVSGVQLTKTDGLGNTTSYTYDSFNDLASVTDATGVVFNYTHDANGNIATKADGLGNTLKLGYDAANNLASVTVAGESQARSSFTYNSQNKLLSYTDALGQQTVYTQSCNSLLSGVTDPLGSKTVYTYNGLQSITSIADANSHTTNFSYDTANRFLSRTDPDGSGAANTYNADSVQQNVTTPTASITRSFDGFGSLAQEVRPEKTITLTYDADRNISQTTETGSLGSRTTTYTYDGANRVASVRDWQNRTVSYTYNLRGQLAAVQSPDGVTTTYTYDNAGRMLLVQTGTDSVRYTYDRAGRRSSKTFSNGVVTQYSYDVFGRITAIVTRDSSNNIIVSYNYTRDANGNVTSATIPDGQLSYTYDADQRLIEDKSSSTSLGAYDHLFPYDNAGNRLDANATYNSGNRLVSNAGGSFSYDNSGNRTVRGSQTYSYDSWNRLVSYSGTSPATYEYDAVYNRVAKTANGVRREFVYLDNRILDEYQGGAAVARYTPGVLADEMLFVHRNAQTYFYHTDALGSVVAITDSTGHVVQRYGYDAWGNLLVNSGSFSFSGTGLVSTFAFAGREYDSESGLYHYRARAYDPAVGRFLQKDAAQGKLYKPLTQNRYAYVSSNPVNLTDPTGNEEFTETALILDSAGEKSLFAIIGYFQGYAVTQLDFVGQYLGIVNEIQGGGGGLGDTPLDASQIFAQALEKTMADIEQIKTVVNAKDFPDQTQGVVGAYLDGVSANDLVADFNKAFKALQSLDGIPEDQQSEVPDLENAPTYGGFGSGTTFGLNFLKAIAPQ